MLQMRAQPEPSLAHKQAFVLAQSLEELLEQEFEQLKNQQLDEFDAQQDTKNDLLRQLTQLSGVSETRSADDLGPEWDEFRSQMRHCRDLHRRNEILIHRKIDAIRGALQSLQFDDPSSSVDMYDRLGKMARRSRHGRGYTDA